MKKILFSLFLFSTSLVQAQSYVPSNDTQAQADTYLTYEGKLYKKVAAKNEGKDTTLVATWTITEHEGVQTINYTKSNKISNEEVVRLIRDFFVEEIKIKKIQKL